MLFFKSTFYKQNHDMDYAVSYDLGTTWHNTWNQTIANLSEQVPIYPNTAGITIFSIPKYGYVRVYAPFFCADPVDDIVRT